MTPERLILWIAFNVFVLGMLALDLGIFHRKAHAVSIKEASIWSAVWILLALVFNLGIYFVWGQEKALEFLTGYVIEKSLSVDNLFVFLMIFQYFATPAIYQHRILFWGIVGALGHESDFYRHRRRLAGEFSLDDLRLRSVFDRHGNQDAAARRSTNWSPHKNPVVRLFQRWIPITNEYQGQQFFVRKEGKIHATLLMLVLVVVETTDVIFAVDSIPAIFAITTGSVYRLHLQCLRDSWTAGALFYARGSDGNVRLPESRPFFRSLLCRSQDVGWLIFTRFPLAFLSESSAGF